MILPAPAASFEWKECAGLPALECKPLGDLASHLFTTRQWRLGAATGSNQPEAGWAEVASALDVGLSRLVRVTQVHGIEVALVRNGVATRTDADVLVTDDPSSALAIRVADCVPLLLADRRTGVVAAVHAGWRGLAAGAPHASVRTLQEEFGSHPSDVLAAAGPSVGACCYEVKRDVWQSFLDQGFAEDQLHQWFSSVPRASAVNPSMPGLRIDATDGRWFFDGWTCTRDQLITAGLDPTHVFTAETCTASHPGAFCSYRRDGPPAGRLVGAIRTLRHRA